MAGAVTTAPLSARDIAEIALSLRSHAERLKAAVEMSPFRLASFQGMAEDAIPVSAATLVDAGTALFRHADALLGLIPAVAVEIETPDA